jgi:hypothetical protein
MIHTDRERAALDLAVRRCLPLPLKQARKQGLSTLGRNLRTSEVACILAEYRRILVKELPNQQETTP